MKYLAGERLLTRERDRLQSEAEIGISKKPLGYQYQKIRIC
jgi:hypothetical protein